MEGVVENPPHPAPPADKKTTPIGIFLYIVAFWSAKNGILSGYGRPASERGAFIPTLEKKMKKKALTLAIAAALSAPASFAATDTSGMRYVSAAEGFYASIRVMYQTKAKKNDKGALTHDSTRFGIRGTNDMGGGLEGFYRYEAHVSGTDGDKSNETNTIRTRLGNVGVRGAFGQVQMGSFWTADYNWVGSTTDFVGVGEGNAGTYYNRSREGRSKNAIEYTTPDLNGFAGAVRVSSNKGGDAVDKSTVGLWNLAAKYEVQGFKVAASYNVIKDGINQASAAYCTGGSAGAAAPTPTGANNALACAADNGDVVAAETGFTDLKTWSLALGYAQDNWYAGAWYGVDSYGDDNGDPVVTPGANNAATAARAKREDSSTLTLGAGVVIDKVELNANWQKVENHAGQDGIERTYGGLGATYRFTSSSRVFAQYRIRDYDDEKGQADREDNHFRIGLRHDF